MPAHPLGARGGRHVFPWLLGDLPTLALCTRDSLRWSPLVAPYSVIAPLLNQPNCLFLCARSWPTRWTSSSRWPRPGACPNRTAILSCWRSGWRRSRPTSPSWCAVLGLAAPPTAALANFGSQADLPMDSMLRCPGRQLAHMPPSGNPAGTPQVASAFSQLLNLHNVTEESITARVEKASFHLPAACLPLCLPLSLLALVRKWWRPLKFCTASRESCWPGLTAAAFYTLLLCRRPAWARWRLPHAPPTSRCSVWSTSCRCGRLLHGTVSL